MNVLSLFDGVSCGQLALTRAGIKFDNYFASEVDKHAIKIAQKNFPNTIQLGNVVNISSENLPKISLLIGGSPCQGFSFSGKQLNFEDPRSKLFFEFDRLLKECNPEFFLLENVNMRKEYQDIISERLGVQPLKINSSLVSGQSRVRLYWTNIPNVTQPLDRGIVLKDVLDGIVTDETGVRLEEHSCIPTLIPTSNEYYVAVPQDQLSTDYTRPVFAGGLAKHKMWKEGSPYKAGSYSQGERVYSVLGKSVTLTAQNGGSTGPGNCLVTGGLHYRKLSIVEAERLQTLPDGYTEGVSNTQRLKTIGNGWTVDVVSHILSFLPKTWKR